MAVVFLAVVFLAVATLFAGAAFLATADFLAGAAFFAGVLRAGVLVGAAPSSGVPNQSSGSASFEIRFHQRCPAPAASRTMPSNGSALSFTDSVYDRVASRTSAPSEVCRWSARSG